MFEDDEEMANTLQVLGLGFEELHKILYGHRVSNVPPPPEGDPRQGMDLVQQKFHVAPGEYLKIDYRTEEVRSPVENMGPLVKEPMLRRVELFDIQYPSNYSESDLSLDAMWTKLLFFNNSGEEIQDLINYIFSFRHIMFWPNEKMSRPYLEHEGKLYPL